MPIPNDSIPQISDNITVISDSLAKIHKADSIQNAIVDSIHQIALKPSGFVGIPLKQTLSGNPIVTISLLILFLLFGYVLTHGRKMILETIKDFFYLKERSSIFIDSTANELRLRISLIFIFIGAVGLFLYSLFFNQNTNLSFEERLLYLALFSAIAVVFLGFKHLTFRVLGFVFFDKNITGIFTKGYFTIIFGLGLAIFPIVIGLTYTSAKFYEPFLIIGLTLSAIAFLLILYKINQIFLTNFYSFFYIILYLCILEILPILIVLRALP